ncbi:MAG: serine/threonine-protein kinase, partial [Vicinamibacteria bacterium]
MSLQPGTRLGSYEIVSLLGAGGMGEVYKAKDLKLGRDVAIKVLREDLASDPERLRRFEQEARAASSLNHPNIVTIHDIGEHEGTRYIAMEYVEGKTLREMLGGEPLSTKKLLKLSTQIADGLAKAHSAGIVHRGLKPENLMVTQDGFVKILDFGLAKLTPQVLEAGPDVA